MDWWNDSTQVCHKVACRSVGDSEAAASVKSPTPAWVATEKLHPWSILLIAKILGYIPLHFALFSIVP